MCSFNKHKNRLRAMLESEYLDGLYALHLMHAMNPVWVPDELKQKNPRNHTQRNSCWLCTLHFWVHFVVWRCNFHIPHRNRWHSVTLRHLQQLQWSLMAKNLSPVWNISSKNIRFWSQTLWWREQGPLCGPTILYQCVTSVQSETTAEWSPQ